MIAYFQAHTNTYAPVEVLREKFEPFIGLPGTVGLSIATRADCLPPEVLDYLEEMNRHTFLLVEYGIESTDDKTLAASTAGILSCRRRCGGKNRFTRNPDRWACHPRTAGRDARKHRAQAGVLSRLPLTTLKMHQLQLIRGTRMALEYRQHPEDFICLMWRNISTS